mgnify:CR=1 FL=1|jgi:hypothetical protein|tara:strand:- start:629 stop:1177 length:549 start_codon:yes stop_codon:yes gene_type:complete
MSDFCTCGQQKTLELDYVVKEDETEEVLPPVEETEKAEEEEVEEEVVEEPDEEKELLDEEKGYARKDMAALASLLKQVLKNLEEEGEEEEEEEKDYSEEKEMPMEEEVPMAEPMLEEEEEVSMSVKEALKTLEKSGMSVYAGKKTTPATRRVVREKPVAINWSEFSKSVDEIHRMEERTGVN